MALNVAVVLALYAGLGVACKSCGLNGHPTGARVVAFRTQPAPPPGRNTEAGQAWYDEWSWWLVGCGVAAALCCLGFCVCKLCFSRTRDGNGAQTPPAFRLLTIYRS